MPKPIHVKALDVTQLRNLLANANRLGEASLAKEIVAELSLRGRVNNRELSILDWNQDRVRDIMVPFRDVASEVKDNRRTEYTEAGGLKIGRAKTDPDYMWIDSYSAIKTEKLNAYFVCYVKSPGDDPSFRLNVNEHVEGEFFLSGLEAALALWKDVAKRATEQI